MNRTLSIIASALLIAAIAAGCGSKSGSDGQGESEGAVARIVLVDKEKCCDCTRERIDGVAALLDRVLDGADIPVIRLHLDTQEEEVAPYREKRSFLALPAVYFLDESGGIVRFLQGELTEFQVRSALGMES